MSKHTVALEIERRVPAAEFMPEQRTEAEGAHAQGPLEPAGDQVPPVKKNRLRRVLLAAVGVLALAGVADFGWNYWTVGRFDVSTDDAYVQADSSTIAPKVSGYIAAVLVRDNERVKAGQVLAKIDDRDLKTALDQATASVAAATATVASKKAALDTQQSIIAAARATVAVDQAKLSFAQDENQRYARLAATGFGSLQNAQNAASGIAAARASVARDEASLTTAVKQLTALKADIAGAQATLMRDFALQRQAQLNLSYATIVSPIAGVVGNRTFRIGQYVQAGTQLMAIVPLAATYIVANYKETQLTDVHAGQKVDIAVDMFPGVTIHGHVDSIAPASGQTFALLPPDNATGNFTKIVQRIPVKIIFDRDNPLADELRPGMSVSPTIETKSVHRLAAAAPAHAG
ncbi:HlyD family secretion protein [Methylovirgula sp. HY1]|uniref:HlyD family secretion protein n=1 Tax=Methylovirgula sp. HY1 TaxID=2822761 RepID=UPI001C5AEC3B|nr:HlyD family secretion protein [Methylovirgula sp. HY1]QXX73758.1 putative multidrug resistance protein EmrK [Methylovirgula sp. HY1]